MTRALIETLREPSEAVRILDAERLDALLRAVWPRAMRGNLAAVDRVLAIMARRAKLLGLDASQKVDSRVEATVAAGVIVVPGMMEESAWEKITRKQQDELAEKERELLLGGRQP